MLMNSLLEQLDLMVAGAMATSLLLLMPHNSLLLF